MKVLHLTLKKKWFDMIQSGEKKEEYRDDKPYWLSRLCDRYEGKMGGDFMDAHRVVAYLFRKFDYIHFTDGYRRDRRSMNFKCEKISIDNGRPEWGAEPGKKYFVIKLGERVN